MRAAFPFRSDANGVSVKEGTRMNGKNGLYMIIGALVVAVVVLGGYVYHEQTEPKGVELSIGQDGIAVQEK
tara:strand:+ start:1996 stop:2208 length:213 start_codon:yes stop_codon:yes gene_type:complete